MKKISFQKIRLLFLLSFFLVAILIAYEAFFIVTNSNRSNIFPDQEMPPQNNSSGLFSSYIGEDSNYQAMKAKSAILIDFDRDNDLDLYYGYAQSYFFENQNGFFIEKMRISLEKRDFSYGNFDFFTKNQILPFFCPFYPFLGGVGF